MELNTLHTVSYGTHELQSFDYYIPSGDVRGVVMWVHGGGWQIGAKDDIYSQSKMQALINEGYAVVSTDYRLTDTHSISHAIDDVETVIDILLNNEYVQEKGLLIAGESAGGHLAITSTFENGMKTGMYPDAVLNMVGPMDLTKAAGPIGEAILEKGEATLDDSPIHLLDSWRDSPEYYDADITIGIYANVTDTLVPVESIAPFVEEISKDHTTIYLEDYQDAPTVGIEDHNVDSIEVLQPLLVTAADYIFM